MKGENNSDWCSDYDANNSLWKSKIECLYEQGKCHSPSTLSIRRHGQSFLIITSKWYSCLPHGTRLAALLVELWKQIRFRYYVYVDLICLMEQMFVVFRSEFMQAQSVEIIVRHFRISLNNSYKSKCFQKIIQRSFLDKFWWNLHSYSFILCFSPLFSYNFVI